LSTPKRPRTVLPHRYPGPDRDGASAMTDHPVQPPSTPAPADDLLEHARQLVTDLVEICQRLPVDSAEAGPVAKIMDRLAEECAEAAAMLRALPERPAKQPGYTAAALCAVMTAAETEHHFAGWVALVLTITAARLGSSATLVAGRDGSWEAAHVLGLVRETAGWQDEHLPAYKDGAPR
jgi:hypothetical protein